MVVDRGTAMAALRGTARLLVDAGLAKPSPKLGQALGPLGVNMMEFCKDFNGKTSAMKTDASLRVKLRAFDDRSFTYEIFPPPTTWFLRRAAGITKGSSMPGHTLVGKVSVKALYEIALIKKQYDSTFKHSKLESVVKTVASTARTMGLELTR
jgi:large subunit ribosomal protein L11